MQQITQKFYDLIFEDKDFIVISKNHGIYVIPDRQKSCPLTLISLLSKDFGKIYTVHRLDAGTGGIMVFAKNPTFHKMLCYIFEHHLIQKKYIALTIGKIFDQSLMLPIAAGGKGKFKINFKSGKNATTTFESIEHNSYGSLVIATPYTGRTHQIRVHLKALKAPLYYDFLYNDKRDDKRLSLFARSLIFNHPVTNQCLSFKAPFSDFIIETAQKLELSLKEEY